MDCTISWRLLEYFFGAKMIGVSYHEKQAVGFPFPFSPKRALKQIDRIMCLVSITLLWNFDLVNWVILICTHLMKTKIIIIILRMGSFPSNPLLSFLCLDQLNTIFKCQEMSLKTS